MSASEEISPAKPEAEAETEEPSSRAVAESSPGEPEGSGKPPESSRKRTDKLFASSIPDFKPGAKQEISANSPSSCPSDPGYALSEQGSPELSPRQHQHQNQPADIESPSSLPTIPEGQVDNREHDFSPSKSDSVSAYDSTQSSPSTRSGLLRQKPAGFFWQLDSHGFPCSAADCNKRCNLWDGKSVICPKCGPFSETRYCSREHLLKDVKPHWAFCGRLAFTHPCHENSVPRAVRAGPPLVPCLLQCDTPERQRQAVYFNACGDLGDYFIFADPFESDMDKRCSSRVITSVVFDDPVEKDRFRRVLAACLFCIFSNPLTASFF